MPRETSSKPETRWFGTLETHGYSLGQVGTSAALITPPSDNSSLDAGGVNDCNPLMVALNRYSGKQLPRVAWHKRLTAIVNAFHGRVKCSPFLTDLEANNRTTRVASAPPGWCTAPATGDPEMWIGCVSAACRLQGPQRPVQSHKTQRDAIHGCPRRVQQNLFVSTLVRPPVTDLILQRYHPERRFAPPWVLGDATSVGEATLLCCT